MKPYHKQPKQPVIIKLALELFERRYYDYPYIIHSLMTHKFIFKPWKSNQYKHERLYRCKECNFWIALRLKRGCAPPNENIGAIAKRSKYFSSIEDLTCDQVKMKEALE